MEPTQIHWYLHVVMPVLLGLLALGLLGLGLRALIARRPYIISARWLLLALLLGFAPTLLMPLALALSGQAEVPAQHSPLLWAGPAILVLMVFAFSRQLRGYVAMAATESSLRGALLTSLSELRLPHEQEGSSVHLPSVPGELYVAVGGWLGLAELKACNRQSKAVLAEIARQMNRHFRLRPCEMNRACPGTYVALGLLLLALDAALVLR